MLCTHAGFNSSFEGNQTFPVCCKWSNAKSLIRVRQTWRIMELLLFDRLQQLKSQREELEGKNGGSSSGLGMWDKRQFKSDAESETVQGESPSRPYQKQKRNLTNAEKRCFYGRVSSKDQRGRLFHCPINVLREYASRNDFTSAQES